MLVVGLLRRTALRPRLRVSLVAATPCAGAPPACLVLPEPAPQLIGGINEDAAAISPPGKGAKAACPGKQGPADGRHAVVNKDRLASSRGRRSKAAGGVSRGHTTEAGPSWAIGFFWQPSWEHPNRFWNHLGSILNNLGLSWAIMMLGPSWDNLEAIFGQRFGQGGSAQ